MLRRLAVKANFANMLALSILALVLSGCSMQQNPAERPDWSLTSADSPANTETQTSQ